MNKKVEKQKEKSTKKLKWTKEHKKILSEAWSEVCDAIERYHYHIEAIEYDLKNKTGIDVEVFYVDGLPVGFGDYHREYELLQKRIR